jgi:hypothetical protein
MDDTLEITETVQIKHNNQFVKRLNKAVIRAELVAATDETNQEINRELGLEGDDITERVPNYFGIGHD